MKVALINMPLSLKHFPSIQLAICKTVLNSVGVESDTFYLNLDYIHNLGSSSWAANFQHHVEWLFAKKLWNQKEPKWGSGIDKSFLEKHADRLASTEEAGHKTIDDAIEHISWENYDVVAFTCTFTQLIASLCLAKLLKDKYPHLKTMFGGMALFYEQAHEYLTHFDWIDYVFIGEADRSLRDVTKRLLQGNENFDNIPGVVYRYDGNIEFHGMDKVPIEEMAVPDYSDYFDYVERNEGFGMAPKNLHLPIEMSRGCGYAAKKQCKFCSIHKYLLGGRDKDEDKLIEEIYSLYDKWKGKFAGFAFTDLLSEPAKLRSIFPRLKKLASVGMRFKTECKPTLCPDDIRILRESGLNKIYFGIETLSPNAIRAMDKGISIIKSLSILKWCKYYDIKSFWNLLINVPFEEESWYDEIDSTLVKMAHLSRPSTMGAIRLERFSVYYQKKLLPNIVPDPIYHNLYPEYVNLDNVAYIYKYDKEGIVVDDKRIEKTRELARSVFQHGYLKFVDELQVEDTRVKAHPVIHSITKSQRDVLKKCTIPIPSRQLSEYDMNELVEKSLIIQLEGKSLSLVEIEDEDVEIEAKSVTKRSISCKVLKNLVEAVG